MSEKRKRGDDYATKTTAEKANEIAILIARMVQALTLPSVRIVEHPVFIYMIAIAALRPGKLAYTNNYYIHSCMESFVSYNLFYELRVGSTTKMCT